MTDVHPGNKDGDEDEGDKPGFKDGSLNRTECKCETLDTCSSKGPFRNSVSFRVEFEGGGCFSLGPQSFKRGEITCPQKLKEFGPPPVMSPRSLRRRWGSCVYLKGLSLSTKQQQTKKQQQNKTKRQFS